MKTKKGAIGVLVFGALITFGIIYFFVGAHEETQTLRAQTNELERELANRDSAYNEVVDLLFTIESQMEEIKTREQLVTDRSLNELDTSNYEYIVSDMRAIDSLIVSTNRRISQLTSQLNNANISLRSFKSKVAQLSKQLDERKQSNLLLRDQLADKKLELEELTYDYQALQLASEYQEELIQDQADQIMAQMISTNKAYVAIATEDELEERKVIEKEGGFLGIGRDVVLNDEISEEDLTEIDVRSVDKLMLNAKKAELITTHPPSSFELVEDDKEVKYIEIKDPVEFWKLSKYLVVAVKS